MGLDMFLYRAPKCDSIDELNTLNERLDKAFVNGKLANELQAIQKEKGFIYEIIISINAWVDLEKYKTDPEGWGNIIQLHERLAYWRKFNALHRWFVDNVQNCEDDCGYYIVTNDHLKELKDILEKLTPENASVLFPPQEGFFLGGTETDEWYWQNVNSLKSTVNFLLDHNERELMYIYHSSW